MQAPHRRRPSSAIPLLVASLFASLTLGSTCNQTGERGSSDDGGLRDETFSYDGTPEACSWCDAEPETCSTCDSGGVFDTGPCSLVDDAWVCPDAAGPSDSTTPIDSTLPSDAPTPDATSADSSFVDSALPDADSGLDAAAFDSALDMAEAAVPSVDVAFLVRGVASAPGWVAVQDGVGSFAPRTPGTDGRLKVPVSDSAGRYAIAWSCESPTDPFMGIYSKRVDVRVLQATVAELSSVTLGCVEGPRLASVSSGLTETGVDTAISESAQHYSGYDARNPFYGSVEGGTRDLLSVVFGPGGAMVRGAISRDVDLSVARSIDLSSTAAAPFESKVIIRPTGVSLGCAAGQARIDTDGIVRLRMSTTTRARLGYSSGSCDVEFQAAFATAAMLGPNDTHLVWTGLAADVVAGALDLKHGVSVFRTIHSLPPGTKLLSVPVDAATIPRTSGESVTTLASGACGFKLAANPSDRLYEASRLTYGSSADVSWKLTVTPARAGASPSFEQPDLSAVAGFDPALAKPGCADSWRVSAVRSAKPLTTAVQTWIEPKASLGDVELTIGRWVQ